MLVYGLIVLRELPIDVFPDLNKPTVTIMTEGHGLAPEEVETLITLPIENTLSGIAHVERIRSTSGIGLSAIFVEFEWGQDIYLARQMVAERLQLARSRLPADVLPVMGPVASLMGQIQQIAITSRNSNASPTGLRSLAEWVLRPQLLTLPGVAQVITMGGGLKQFQVLFSAEKLSHFQISLEDLNEELAQISKNSGGGFIDQGSQEILVRNIGAISSIKDIENTAVASHFGRPIRIGDIAVVKEGTQFKRGEASYQGKPAIILVIQKQPNADTIEVTENIESMIKNISASFPEGVEVHTDVFRQADFIASSISGIIGKLKFGTILVFLVLIIFLANLKMSVITLTAIPLSFAITFITFKFLGLSVNTMTLGGLAIAIGELVDDSIVDVENIYRRLRLNATAVIKKPILKVVFAASSEVRNSIVLATIIIALVFLPLLSLSGIEGRLFSPLALSYLTALAASLLVSLTITPVLCSLLLNKISLKKHADTLLVGFLKFLDAKLLRFFFKFPIFIFSLVSALIIFAVLLLPKLGFEFLPTFKEKTAMIALFTPPGTSLKASDEVGFKAEKLIMASEGIKSVSRRTGRAELDEHAMGVNVSELDVDFHDSLQSSREKILTDIREKLAEIPELVGVNVGQPLSHLIDHMLSGVSAQIAIKIFGPDLGTLRGKAAELKNHIKEIPGLVDVRVEQQGLIPQLKIHLLREEAAKYGLSSGKVTHLLESAFNGEIIAQVIEEQRSIGVFSQFDETSRGTKEKMENTVLKIMPDGTSVRVKDLADVYFTDGPNEINRENLQRRLVISANVSGRDLGSVANEVQERLRTSFLLPEGYFYTLGGQFEAQKTASRDILIFSCMSLFLITLILLNHFKSWLIVVQILLTVPLAFIGGVISLYFMGGVMSIASLIGFVTLCGIASRNSIMMISHYLHLIRTEGHSFSQETIILGSLERLTPVLMTAVVSIFALSPIMLAGAVPGSEILQPVATVIVGGLISSTLLDVFVTPTVFYYLGKRINFFNPIISKKEIER